MSSLGPTDTDLHYSDNSHRWIPPDPYTDQDAWNAVVQSHMDLHRANQGGPSDPDRVLVVIPHRTLRVSA